MEGISRGSVVGKDCRLLSKLAFKELHVMAPSYSVMLMMDPSSPVAPHISPDVLCALKRLPPSLRWFLRCEVFDVPVVHSNIRPQCKPCCQVSKQNPCFWVITMPNIPNSHHRSVNALRGTELFCRATFAAVVRLFSLYLLMILCASVCL